MASFNKITICGYLGRDPELRYTGNSNAVCNLSIATTERRKDRNGEAEDITTWFRVTVWGKQGELCNEYLRKGSQVFIEGRLRQEEYTDREGNKRYSLEVNATDVQFLGKKGENGGGNEAPAQTQADKQQKRDALKSAPRGVPQTAQSIGDEDEIPF